ncbi:MAG: FAD-binding protein [Chloroflexi bacterium]|nr:FAD-binding protein [Chloroflexota bacterium]
MKPSRHGYDSRALQAELKKRVRGEVRFDLYSRVLYSTDASIYEMEPIGVVIPRDREDVLATVDTCGRLGVPVLPRGAGTSLAGQAVNHAVVLDFSKYMNQVLSVNEEERWVRVQPGIVIDELNEQVRHHGLQYPIDPATASRATVGGGIGNNSCGAHSIVYGKTVDHVLELQCVLSDGSEATFLELPPAAVETRTAQRNLEGQIYREVRRLAESYRDEVERRFPKVMRRVGGYNLDLMLGQTTNLASLLVGSEGTLAVVTEAKMNLVPRPRRTGLAVAHFRSLLEAMEATVELLKENPSAIELMDKTILDQARNQVVLRRQMGFVQGDPAALLLVEVYGESDVEIVARLDGIEARTRRAGLGYAVVKVSDAAQQALVWNLRKAGLGLLASIKGDLKPVPFVEDTAVSPEKLPAFIERFDQIVREEGTTAGYYGHASVGCIHIRPKINLKLQGGVDQMVAIANRISDLVLEFGGSLTGEHGDGIVRGVFTEKMFGSRLYQAFRELKAAFDPKGIMNPGKIVDCPPMTENLRFGPRYKATPVATTLDFYRELGLDGAVELCTGIGACRKTLGGAMCPSYMATREEEHSTRGRANALRAVLSGLLPTSEFTSRRLYDVLDLCLECKACKAECESGVDMAKLKYEFLFHYYSKHGYPLRARLFARTGTLNRLGCALAPVSNWAARSLPTRWAVSALGIHPGRRLPPFARPTFEAWFRRRRPSPTPGERGTVLYLNDTFTNYNYPAVGQAAVKVLEALGYRVQLWPAACCGRTLISKGMLERAQSQARKTVEALFPLVQQGMKIVGTEPSCLLTLRDEYADLLPGDERARLVAENALLLDEFIVAAQEDGAARGLALKPIARKALFHGHCHQKALVGTEASLQALRMVPGLEVKALDAGCCGMAGAFGFEKEHYDVSMKIGEQRLFPAVRAAPDALVIVTGVSCRQQVEHGTGAKPLHLAEVLAMALEK